MFFYSLINNNLNSIINERQASVVMQYYNNHAVEYVKKTLPISMTEQYGKFLRNIPNNGSILDAGCGSGRDALYFLKNGYKVDAFDASTELVKLAEELTGLNISCLRFQEFCPHTIYDGIWANASLLHVPQKQLHDVLKTFKASLKSGGILFCSFKYGKKDAIDELGRSFTNKTCEMLDKDLSNAGFTSRRSIALQQSTTPEGSPQAWVTGLAVAP